MKDCALYSHEELIESPEAECSTLNALDLVHHALDDAAGNLGGLIGYDCARYDDIGSAQGISPPFSVAILTNL